MNEMSKELDLCSLCKYNSNCFGANGFGPCALKNELTYKEELEKQAIYLQNREKALDEIIELNIKLYSDDYCFDDYGREVDDIIKKYKLCKK